MALNVYQIEIFASLCLSQRLFELLKQLLGIQLFAFILAADVRKERLLVRHISYCHVLYESLALVQLHRGVRLRFLSFVIHFHYRQVKEFIGFIIRFGDVVILIDHLLPDQFSLYHFEIFIEIFKFA